ncbi:unnamed protein product [Amoebophrya sp. A120]|nr:unnamed protein product [Amoebophrya sp. A120]|eukprot:GSA120T00002306001.1
MSQQGALHEKSSFDDLFVAELPKERVPRQKTPLRRYFNDTFFRRQVLRNAVRPGRFVVGKFSEADRLIGLGEDYPSDLEDEVASSSSESSAEEGEIDAAKGLLKINAKGETGRNKKTEDQDRSGTSKAVHLFYSERVSSPGQNPRSTQQVPEQPPSFVGDRNRKSTVNFPAASMVMRASQDQEHGTVNYPASSTSNIRASQDGTVNFPASDTMRTSPSQVDHGTVNFPASSSSGRPSTSIVEKTTGELFENVLSAHLQQQQQQGTADVAQLYATGQRAFAELEKQSQQQSNYLLKTKADLNVEVLDRLNLVERERDLAYRTELGNQRRGFSTILNRLAQQHRADLLQEKQKGKAQLQAQIDADDKRYHALMKKDQMKFDDLFLQEQEHADKLLNMEKSDEGVQRDRNSIFLELQRLKQTDFSKPIQDANSAYKEFERMKQEEYLRALKELRSEDSEELLKQREAMNDNLVLLVSEFHAANEKRQAEMENRMWELMNGQMLNVVEALAKLQPPEQKSSRRNAWGRGPGGAGQAAYMRYNNAGGARVGGASNDGDHAEDLPQGFNYREQRPWGQSPKWTLLDGPKFDQEKYWTQTIIPVPKEMQLDADSDATSDCLVSVSAESDLEVREKAIASGGAKLTRARGPEGWAFPAERDSSPPAPGFGARRSTRTSSSAQVAVGVPVPEKKKSSVRASNSGRRGSSAGSYSYPQPADEPWLPTKRGVASTSSDFQNLWTKS